MEGRMNALWESLNEVERVDGVPVEDGDREREDRLLRLIEDYVAAEDEYGGANE